jgi:hypothetical protein
MFACLLQAHTQMQRGRILCARRLSVIRVWCAMMCGVGVVHAFEGLQKD